MTTVLNNKELSIDALHKKFELIKNSDKDSIKKFLNLWNYFAGENAYLEIWFQEISCHEDGKPYSLSYVEFSDNYYSIYLEEGDICIKPPNRTPFNCPNFNINDTYYAQNSDTFLTFNSLNSPLAPFNNNKIMMDFMRWCLDDLEFLANYIDIDNIQ